MAKTSISSGPTTKRTIVQEQSDFWKLLSLLQLKTMPRRRQLLFLSNSPKGDYWSDRGLTKTTQDGIAHERTPQKVISFWSDRRLTKTTQDGITHELDGCRSGFKQSYQKIPLPSKKPWRIVEP